MMVMAAASLWHLAYDANTVFNPAMDAHNNNAHTLSLAFSQLSAAAFTITARSKAGITANITDAQNEFLRIASVLMLRLGHSTSRDGPKAKEAVYVILDRLVKDSAYLTADALERFFTY